MGLSILKKVLTIILIALSLLSVVACSSAKYAEESFSSTSFFGTYIEVVLVGEDDSIEQKSRLSQAKEEMFVALQEINSALDADEETGDIARFNALSGGEKVAVTKYTADCFSLAKEIYEATLGAYNPAVYGLVDLWGFSSRVLSGSDVTCDYDRSEPSVPSEKYIVAFKGLTNFAGVTLTQENDIYYLNKSQDSVIVDGKEYFLRIDFGGICKGYAGDVLRGIADKYGIKKGYLSMGQSSITFFDSPDGDGYDLDMENPINSTQILFTKKNIKNQSISVSGDYQRYFEEDGKRYCHIIDATTGYPVDSDIKAVFAQCSSSAVCDAVTTALMTMSAEKIAELTQSNAFKALGVNSVTIVRQTKGELQVISNANDLSVKEGAQRYVFHVSDDGVSFKKTAEKYLPMVLFFIMTVVVVVVLLAEKNKKEQHKPKYDFANSRFFMKTDCVVYVILAVIVVILFLGVGAGVKKSTLTAIDVYQGEYLLATYNVKKGILTTSLEWQNELQVIEEDGKIILRVYDEEKTCFNEIEFFDGQAVMTRADCYGKDCTKLFNSVTKANQTVVCLPHDVRIVGVGEGNKEVR